MYFPKARLREKTQPMMLVEKETSSVIPVIGGSGTAAGLAGTKNVMDDDPSILQVKQEDFGVQESPFLRIMGWFRTP